MIILSNWSENRHEVSEAKQLQIKNLLIKQSVQDRYQNNELFSYQKNRTYYNYGKWVITYKKKQCTLIEFSFNCLKLGIFHNTKNTENYSFFRYVDLFYRNLSMHKMVTDKSEWIIDLKNFSTKSKDNNAEVFYFNITQYLEKDRLIKEIQSYL